MSSTIKAGVRFALGALRPALTALMLLAAFCAPSPGQERDYELERRIEAAKDEIRTLMSKGRYEEVIQRADALLLIDPQNSSAVVWKDRAQLMLAAPPPDRGSILGIDAPRIDNAPTPTPRPIEQPVYTPVPMTERPSSASTLGLPIGLLVGLAAGALLFVGLAVFAVARVNASRRRQRDAALAAAVLPEFAPPPPAASSDMHDAVTHVSAGQSKPVLADDDSVMQYGSVGRRDPETLSDQETMSDPVTRSLTPAPEEEEEEGPALSFVPPPVAAAPPPPPPPPAKPAPAKAAAAAPPPDSVTGISLDFRSPEAAPEEAAEEMTFGSLMFAGGEETQAPPAAAKKEDDALSFNSLMFAGESQTKPPAPDAEDPAAMSFDSLMFKGADETRMPGAPAASADDDDPNAMSYTSVMFAGDETVAPGAAPKKPAATHPAVDPLDVLGETVRLPAGAPAPAPAEDLTLHMPPPENPGGLDLENTIRFADDDEK